MSCPPPTAVGPARRAAAATGLALALLLVACGGDDPPPALRHVLLITFDTTRADRLGSHGATSGATPRLDRLAADGVRFARCMTTAPTTLPGHASILTGLYPFRHGARNNGTHVLPEDVDTLAERLADAGFRTGAVVSAKVLDASYGLGQGFEVYDDDLSSGEPGGEVFYQETAADDAVRRALAWIDGPAAGDGPGGARDERPFFLWVHFFDPHRPFKPPEPYASRFEDRYDGEIAFADAQAGVLLDGLAARGLRDETLVVVTADHGESLGEHGESTHGVFVYEATTHVPLLFEHGSLAAGVVADGLTSVADIPPTVLELLGLPPLPDADGRSLADVLTGARDDVPPRKVYAETLLPYYSFGWSDLRALVDGAGRFVRAPSPELYDHATDPDELRDLHDARPELAAAYASALESLLGDGERGTDPRDLRPLDDATRADLAQLGYVLGTDLPGLDTDRPDPKDVLAHVRDVNQARQLVERGAFHEALQRLDAIVALSPDAPEPQGLRGRALAGLGRRAEAREALLLGVSGAAPVLTDILQLAELDRAEDPAAAGAWLDLARRLYPAAAAPWTLEGGWAVADEDWDRAHAAYTEALERDPGSATLLVGLGRAQRGRGETTAALESFRRATELSPSSAAAWFQLGRLAHETGRGDVAGPALETAARLRPNHVLTWTVLAEVRAARGDVGGAEQARDRARQLGG